MKQKNHLNTIISELESNLAEYTRELSEELIKKRISNDDTGIKKYEEYQKILTEELEERPDAHVILLLSKLKSEYNYTPQNSEDIQALYRLHHSLNHKMAIEDTATPMLVLLAAIFLLFLGLYLGIVFSPMLFIISLVAMIGITISPFCERAPELKPNFTQKLIMEKQSLEEARKTKGELLEFIKTNNRAPKNEEELNPSINREKGRYTQSKEIKQAEGASMFNSLENKSISETTIKKTPEQK